MFSKTRVTETRPTPDAAPQAAPVAPERSTPEAQAPAASPRARVAPSVLSADLTVTGNIKTQGDIQIEGTVEGDIRAHQLTIGETATIKGEIVGDDVIVNGRVVKSDGRLVGVDLAHARRAVEETVEYAAKTLGDDAWLNGMHPEIPETRILTNPYQYTK